MLHQEKEFRKPEDVGLGPGVRGCGAVRAAVSGAADPDPGPEPVCGVWEFSDKWGFYTCSCYYLLCSYLHFLVSYWDSCVYGLMMVDASS